MSYVFEGALVAIVERAGDLVRIEWLEGIHHERRDWVLAEEVIQVPPAPNTVYGGRTMDGGRQGP